VINWWNAILVLITFCSSIASGSPAPGGMEQPRPRQISKAAIIVVDKSESNIEEPIKQQPKAAVSRGHVPARRTVAMKGEK